MDWLQTALVNVGQPISEAQMLKTAQQIGNATGVLFPGRTEALHEG